MHVRVCSCVDKMFWNFTKSMCKKTLTPTQNRLLSSPQMPICDDVHIVNDRYSLRLDIHFEYVRYTKAQHNK